MVQGENNPGPRASRGAEPWRGLAARIASLGSASRREQTRTTIAEGTRLIERARRAAHPIEAVMVADGYGSTEREAALLEALGEDGVPIERAPEGALVELSGGRSFGAILAIVSMPADSADWILGTEESSLLLVAVDVQEAGNAGALLRTAHALGADAFVALGTTDPWHPKAVRTSKGSVFALPCLRERQALEWTRALAARGFTSIGLATERARSLHELERSGQRLALFVGSEAHGLQSNLASELTHLVRIDMVAGVDSLSVNAAAAIGLHELRKHRSHRD